MSTNNCPLCLEEIGINSEKLPECKCSLGFHAECRDIFIANNFGCPFCPKVKKKKDNLNLDLDLDLNSDFINIVILVFSALLVTFLMYKIYNCNKRELLKSMCQVITLCFMFYITMYMIDLWANNYFLIKINIIP